MPEWLPAELLEVESSRSQDVAEAMERLEATIGSGGLGIKSARRDLAEVKARNFLLPKLVPLLVERSARWRYINSGFQFRFPDDSILCWWPRTGSCLWQGSKRSDRDVREEIISQPKSEFLPKDHVVQVCRVCLVCGEGNSSNSCPKCAKTQTDLCTTCFPLAHWCA